jgi:hypothetical protein
VRTSYLHFRSRLSGVPAGIPTAAGLDRKARSDHGTRLLSRLPQGGHEAFREDRKISCASERCLPAQRLVLPSVGRIGQFLSIAFHWAKDCEQLDLRDDEGNIQGSTALLDLPTGFVNLRKHLTCIGRIHHGGMRNNWGQVLTFHSNGTDRSRGLGNVSPMVLKVRCQNLPPGCLHRYASSKDRVNRLVEATSGERMSRWTCSVQTQEYTQLGFPIISARVTGAMPGAPCAGDGLLSRHPWWEPRQNGFAFSRTSKACICATNRSNAKKLRNSPPAMNCGLDSR